MVCPRCAAELAEPPTRSRWCAECELAYDTWSRRHATDIVWAALPGMVVLLVVAVGLPILGVGSLIAAAGVFAGFGTFIGLYRFRQKRRRSQFLQSGAVPRAYLTTTT